MRVPGRVRASGWGQTRGGGPRPQLASALRALVSGRSRGAPTRHGGPTPRPRRAALNKLSARFAPVDLVVDVAALPASERAALVELIAAAKIMDALFLRQVWAGNEALLLDLVRDRSPLGQARLHAFLQNKGPWLRLDGDRPFLRRRRPEAAGRQLLSGGRDQGRGGELDAHAAGAGARRRGGLLHHHPADARRQAAGDPVQPRVPGRAGARRRAAARRRPPDAAADAARVPGSARRRLPVQRLLRQRRRLDEAGRQHRTDHRTLRDVRGRLVQRQGGVRGVRQPARRRRDREAGQAGGRAAGDREQPADRRQAAQPEARARRRRSASSTSCSARATPTRRCRPRPSTSPTTNASSSRSAASARCIKNVQRAKFDRVLLPISRIALAAARSRRGRRSTRSSRTS